MISLKDIVITAVLVLVLALSIGYIIKAKKNGAKCIGCPSSGKHKHCNCGCNDIEE